MVVVAGVMRSIERTSVVPAVDALAEEGIDAPAIGLGPTLRLDRGVQDGDRSGAADRLVEFRSWAEGELAQCVDAFDHRVGGTDNSHRWEVGLDPPVGRKHWFDERHGEWNETEMRSRERGEYLIAVESVPFLEAGLLRRIKKSFFTATARRKKRQKIVNWANGERRRERWE